MISGVGRIERKIQATLKRSDAGVVLTYCLTILRPHARRSIANCRLALFSVKYAASHPAVASTSAARQEITAITTPSPPPRIAPAAQPAMHNANAATALIVQASMTSIAVLTALSYVSYACLTQLRFTPPPGGGPMPCMHPQNRVDKSVDEPHRLRTPAASLSGVEWPVITSTTRGPARMRVATAA